MFHVERAEYQSKEIKIGRGSRYWLPNATNTVYPLFTQGDRSNLHQVGVVTGQ